MKIYSVSANMPYPEGQWYKVANLAGWQRLHRRLLKWAACKIIQYLATDVHYGRIDTNSS